LDYSSTPSHLFTHFTHHRLETLPSTNINLLLTMCAPTREEFLATSIAPANPSPEETGCTICTEDYNTTTHTPVTFSDHASCKHTFCTVCITTWLNTNGANTCPLCRRQLFVLAPEEEEEEEEVDRDMNMDSDSDLDDSDGSNLSDSDEEDEEDEDDESIPLSYLYRNELRLRMTPAEVDHLLTTIWHKFWNLLSTYRQHASAQASPDWPSLDAYLPTKTMLVTSFLATVSAATGTDIAGALVGRKLGRLEALLSIVLGVQKVLVRAAHATQVGEAVPGFPRRWATMYVWSLNMSLLLGTPPLPLARME
jgi:uncharacterized Zn finger protein (UPF0148 family)